MESIVNQCEISERIISIADKYGSRNPQQLKQLKHSFAKYDKEELFRGCIQIFAEKSSNSFERQQLAGRLLYTVRPQVHIKIKEVVRLCLDTYDVSVEELPWYLCSLVGKERVLALLEELTIESITENERDSLDTMIYWTKCYST